ncbi:Transmembrane emp24 domain-containing protein 1 [Lamellibrachia satsuma]|nr:Transmembrane emp24 domain-containing protein 1 [Lamellibrachia satsuma]
MTDQHDHNAVGCLTTTRDGRVCDSRPWRDGPRRPLRTAQPGVERPGVEIYRSLRLTPLTVHRCPLPSFLQLSRDTRHNMASQLLKLTAVVVVVVAVVSGNYSDDYEFDFDGLPGVNHEFKMEVPAGSRECFYQSMKTDAFLQVAFHVLRGADLNVDFAIMKPDGSILREFTWTSEGTANEKIEQEGVYALCIDNTISRFSGKLVDLYLSTYVVSDWHAFGRSVEEFTISVKTVRTSLDNVRNFLSQSRTMQAVSKQHQTTDWYNIRSNNAYVSRWSVFTCVVIVVTSCVQVYFVRRLFSTSNVTPSSKPRA